MIGLDSNVLLYYEGVDDAARRDRAQSLVQTLSRDGLLAPAQALGELYRVTTGKSGWSPDDALAAIRRWMSACVVIPTTAAVITEAAERNARAGFGIWDSIIVCAAASGGGELLLSEDMQDGFVYRQLTIINPFAAEPHPLLASALEQAS